MNEWESVRVEDDRWVSPTEVGLWLSMTAERVRQLAVDDVFRRQDGTYPLRECVLRYLAWRDADRRDATRTAGDNRIRDLRADEIALRIEKESGALIAEARAEGLAIVNEHAGKLRSGVLAVPVRLIADLTLRKKVVDELSVEFDVIAKTAGAEGALPAPPPNRAARRAARHARPAR